MQDLIWSIGEPHGPSPVFFDNFRDPTRLGSGEWRVGDRDQRWPLFHPSEADPDAGYTRHPLRVRFTMPAAPAPACLLRVRYLITTPRIPFLEVRLNGTTGLAHLSPLPARLGEAHLGAALHASLYADGEAALVLGPQLLRQGENELVLSCCDGGEVLRAERPEARKRLDRMASAAGLIYQQIALLALGELAPGPLERLTLRPTALYRRDRRGTLLERCHLDLELRRAIEGGELQLRIEGDPELEQRLAVPGAALGHLRLTCEIPDGAPPAAYRVTGRLDGVAVDERGELERRRKWTVHVCPNVHADIGYTHRQPEVAERLAWNIDQALALASQTTYHLDAAWALEGYLSRRDPSRRAELAGKVREGRIAVSGIYADLLTHYAALEDLIRNLVRADRLLERLGAPRTEFACIVDVASLSGALPTLFEGAGIRFLAHAGNQDRGPFRLNGALHRRSPYLWEGPGGGRVMVWLARMYCELRKVCGSPPVPDAAAAGLDLWLREYERADYPGQDVLLFGQEPDNAELDPQPSLFVERWNSELAYPQLVLGNPGDFLHALEAAAPNLPRLRGDGGAYWEDGVGSAAALSAQVRCAQAMLPAAERLEALAVLHHPGWRYPLEEFDEAWRQILLWDEHTWGAFLSCRDPDALLTRDQWAVKEEMGRQAWHLSSRLLHAAATQHALSFGTDGREIVVLNPNSWTSTGSVEVEVEPDERPVDPATGEELPFRRRTLLASQSTVEVLVEDLPGLSYRRLQLGRGPRPAIESAPRAATTSGPLVLENRHYRLELDSSRGRALRILDRRLDRELVDQEAPWGFGQLLYASGGEGTRLCSNQADLPVGQPELDGSFALEELTRERFAFGQSVTLRGRVPAGELEVEWTLCDHAPRIDLRYRYRKEARRSKEAVYVAFPLALPGAEVLSDGQLGWISWARDVLPGACKDWLPLQTAVWVRGAGAQVLIASPDIPLVCVGDVVRGLWSRERELCGGRILSYVLNNYWHTNYRPEQGGELCFGYRLTSAAELSPGECYRFGWEARRPLYGHRIGFQDFRPAVAPYDQTRGGCLAVLEGEDVVLSTLKGADRGAGLVARFQEIGGRPGRARLRLPGLHVTAAWKTDLVERDLAPLTLAPDGTLAVEVPAWGLATVRFEVER